MPDVFEIANAVGAMKSYVDAKKKRDVIAMEKARQDMNARIALMQQKLNREQLLQRGQQFQQTYGLQERTFEEVTKPLAATQQQVAETQRTVDEVRADMLKLQNTLTKETLPNLIKTTLEELRAREKGAKEKGKESEERIKAGVPEKAAEERMSELQSNIQKYKVAGATAEAKLENLADIAEYERLKNQKLLSMARAGKIPEIDRANKELERIDAEIENIRSQIAARPTAEATQRLADLNIQLAQAQIDSKKAQQRLYDMQGVGTLIANQTNAQLKLLQVKRDLQQQKMLPSAAIDMLNSSKQDLIRAQGYPGIDLDVPKVQAAADGLRDTYSMLGVAQFDTTVVDKKGRPVEQVYPNVVVDNRIDLSKLTDKQRENIVIYYHPTPSELNKIAKTIYPPAETTTITNQIDKVYHDVEDMTNSALQSSEAGRQFLMRYGITRGERLAEEAVNKIKQMEKQSTKLSPEAQRIVDYAESNNITDAMSILIFAKKNGISADDATKALDYLGIEVK